MIVFVWLLFGIFTAVIAGNKNRNGFGWFILGCLFGPFALITIACLSRIDPSEILAQQKGHPAEKKCPRCAEMVKYEALICRFCNYEFPAATVPEPALVEDLRTDPDPVPGTSGTMYYRGEKIDYAPLEVRWGQMRYNKLEHAKRAIDDWVGPLPVPSSIAMG